MRVLITGAGGQLGRALVHTAPPNVAVTALDKAQMDVTVHEATQAALARYNPDIIVNTAAYTAVDRAETEPDKAYVVNAIAPGYLAQLTRASGARLIHLSTDYVFDGDSNRPYSPNDPPVPLNVYGASKLEGERRALSICPERTLILRSSWLYAACGHNFVSSMLRLMRERESIRIVADQIGTPTWVNALAQVIWTMVRRTDCCGVYHWSDDGQASWYEFALAIQETALDFRLLTKRIPLLPITAEEYAAPARRPSYSVLNKGTTIADFGVSPMFWRSALRQMLQELAHA